MIDALPPPPAPLPGSNAALLDVADARVALGPYFAEVAPLLRPRSGQLMAVGAVASSRGRTTTAVAMAHLAARNGASVLVVSDHGTDGRPVAGLRDIVLGYANPRGLARYDAGSDFTLMRTGCAGPEDFWALVNHRNFAAVAGMLKEFWDFVLVEVPRLRDDRAPPLPVGLFGAFVLCVDPSIARQEDVAAAIAAWPEPLRAVSRMVLNYPAPVAARPPAHAWAT